MIKSMTGYGRHREVVDGRDILCEVKSVNSRYLDTNIKMGRTFSALEETVKQYASFPDSLTPCTKHSVSGPMQSIMSKLYAAAFFPVS